MKCDEGSPWLLYNLDPNWIISKDTNGIYFCFVQLIPKGPGKREHIVADTLLPVMFLGLRKPGNICCGHKMFLNKIRNIFCVPDTKFESATTVRAGKRGNICVGNNVSSFARALRNRYRAILSFLVDQTLVPKYCWAHEKYFRIF